MGDPKKRRKIYESPRKPWDKARIEEENKLKEFYGLKNKREIWRSKTILRGKRQNARKLLAKPLEERLKREKELLNSLMRLGVLREKAVLDDVLTLSVNDLLERRLQTIVWRKGLSNTTKQARQFIVHGHIAVNGRKVDRPSYLVPKEEEEKIKFYGKPIELLIKKSAKAEIKEEKVSSKDELRKKFEETKEAAEKIDSSEAKGEGKESKQEVKEEKPEAKPVSEAAKPEEKKEVKAEAVVKG